MTRKAIEKRLRKVEAEINKLGIVSPLTHGWQTQRFARAERKLDMLCQERWKLWELLGKFDK
jgi:hypothetical protein